MVNVSKPPPSGVYDRETLGKTMSLDDRPLDKKDRELPWVSANRYRLTVSIGSCSLRLGQIVSSGIKPDSVLASRSIANRSLQ